MDRINRIYKIGDLDRINRIYRIGDQGILVEGVGCITIGQGVYRRPDAVADGIVAVIVIVSPQNRVRNLARRVVEECVCDCGITRSLPAKRVCP